MTAKYYENIAEDLLRWIEIISNIFCTFCANAIVGKHFSCDSHGVYCTYFLFPYFPEKPNVLQSSSYRYT